jgi:hypothetical protein
MTLAGAGGGGRSGVEGIGGGVDEGVWKEPLRQTRLVGSLTVQ